MFSEKDTTKHRTLIGPIFGVANTVELPLDKALAQIKVHPDARLLNHSESAYISALPMAIHTITFIFQFMLCYVLLRGVRARMTHTYTYTHTYTQNKNQNTRADRMRHSRPPVPSPIQSAVELCVRGQPIHGGKVDHSRTQVLPARTDQAEGCLHQLLHARVALLQRAQRGVALCACVCGCVLCFVRVC